jgi:hypothetical protein
MKFRGGEFSTGTTGNFQSELTHAASKLPPSFSNRHLAIRNRCISLETKNGDTF